MQWNYEKEDLGALPVKRGHNKGGGAIGKAGVVVKPIDPATAHITVDFGDIYGKKAFQQTNTSAVASALPAWWVVNWVLTGR